MSFRITNKKKLDLEIDLYQKILTLLLFIAWAVMETYNLLTCKNALISFLIYILLCVCQGIYIEYQKRKGNLIVKND
ncbi:hypothetical protein C0583_02695 [Candidatus Parcubacteria bacterium]|nr:MAG: hypothetical protein C0583_02695 [Candidatus Parcubacteria bacterium]